MTNQKGLFVRCLLALILFAGWLQSAPAATRALASSAAWALAPTGPSAQALERIWNEVEQPDGALLQPPPLFPQKTLTASDGAEYDSFGESVALSADTLVMGAPYADIGGMQDTGAVYIFYRHQGGADNWGQAAKLTPPDGGAGTLFGSAVALSGDILAVGALGDDVSGVADAGAVYLLSRDQGGEDNWGQVKKLTIPNAGPETYFGSVLLLSGDTLAVGCPRDDIGGAQDAGAAYVFYRDQGGADNWGQVAKLTATNAGAETYFGRSVALSGDTIVVGAQGDDVGGAEDAGAAYVFYRHQGGEDTWGQVKKLTASDVAAHDLFGQSVAINGELVLVGANCADIGANQNQGAAYLFARDQGGADTWGQVKKLTASDGAAHDLFGISVAINGELVLVGASYADISANSNQGAVVVFGRDWGGADNWGQMWKITPPFAGANDYFGNSLALSGDLLAAGMPFGNVGSNTNQGAVYLYSLTALAQSDLTPALVYTSDDGHIHEIALKGRWHERDLTAAAGAPLAQIYARPMGVVRSDGVPMVVYRGTDYHVYAIYLEQQAGSPWRETWHVADLCQITGSPDALSDPYGFVRSDGTTTVLYTGIDEHIHELRLEGGNWIWADLTLISSAPAAGFMIQPYIRSDRYSAILFKGITDYLLYELRLESDGWKCSNLTALSGAPAPWSAPAAYVRSDGITAINYVNNKHVYELRLEGGNWLWADLTDLSGAPEGDWPGPVTSGYVRSDGMNVVVYQAYDGNRIYELRLENGWQAYELTSVEGAVPGYYPIAYVRTGGINAVVYLGTDHHIHEIGLGSTWHPADLTSLAGASAAGAYGYPWPYNRPYIPSHIFLPMVRK
ncbi:MAG: FG-GAP repeat protein [Anaerolineales bacterium]|nr:FG-GAP repeat protein [Anaerolineales bacterium]